MNRQRYEPVPQRNEVIILDSIHNSPNYNYNSAIPNSVSSASSQHTPSIAPSVPSSPPPSFHTHSSPSTPRPTPSTISGRTHALSNHSNPSYAELWGVAPSTVGGTETEGGVDGGMGLGAGGIGTSNDALATIAGLKQRVEWLEESIGRLLLERDALTNLASINTPSSSSSAHSNCCVSFTDASPDLERAVTLRHSNCCVRFRKSKARSSTGSISREELMKERFAMARTVAVVFVIMLIVVLVFGKGSGGGWGGPPGPGLHGEGDAA